MRHVNQGNEAGAPRRPTDVRVPRLPLPEILDLNWLLVITPHCAHLTKNNLENFLNAIQKSLADGRELTGAKFLEIVAKQRAAETGSTEAAASTSSDALVPLHLPPLDLPPLQHLVNSTSSLRSQPKPSERATCEDQDSVLVDGKALGESLAYEVKLALKSLQSTGWGIEGEVNAGKPPAAGHTAPPPSPKGPLPIKVSSVTSARPRINSPTEEPSFAQEARDAEWLYCVDGNRR